MAITHLMPIIGILGAILGLSGIFLSTLTETNTYTIFLFEGLGLLCLTIYLVFHWQQLKTFSSKRSTQLGVNSLVAIALLAGILGMINFLVIQHGGRWDLSETQHFTLAPQTYQVLGQLKTDVLVTVFSHERSPGFHAYQDLLEGYGHGSSHLTVRFVDPEKQPQLARELDIAKLDTAVFQSQGQTVHVLKPTEPNLTNALIRVTLTTQKRILFLDNHGERRLDNEEGTGLSFLREALRNQGYLVDQGILDGKDRLTEEYSLIVLAGPQSPLTEAELERLSRFISGGGRALFLIDPQSTHGLDELFGQWGITLSPGIIVDPSDRMAQGSPTALLVRRFTEHPITHGFTAPILFPVSQPLRHQGSSSSQGLTALAETSEDSWAEVNLEDHQPVFDMGVDQKGPFAVAVAIELNHEKDPLSSEEAHVVILGNSAFTSNAYFKLPGNTDFILNTVAWLTQDTTLVAISPKELSFQPFIPNPTQEHILLAIQVFSIPLLMMFVGISVWRRRSRL